MKFDVVLGNPPFQPEVKKTGGKGCGSGSMIWHKFIELAFGLCRESGHMLFITPANWRQGGYGKGGPYRHVRDKMWASGLFWYEDCRVPVEHFKNIGMNTSIDAWCLKNERTFSRDLDLPEPLKLLKLAPRSDVPRETTEAIAHFLDVCYSEEAIPCKFKDRYKMTARNIPLSDIKENGWYPLFSTSAKLRKGLYIASSTEPSSIHKHKVVVSDSGDLYPTYDAGTCGCSRGAWFEVRDEREAQVLIAAIDRVGAIMKHFANKGVLRNRMNLLTRLPKRLLSESPDVVFGKEVMELIER